MNRLILPRSVGRLQTQEMKKVLESRTRLSKEERDLLTLTLDFFTAKMKKEGTLSKNAKEFEAPVEAIYGMPQTPC